MATAILGVAALVAQMQQTLDAINYHLARISDTKAHDDEIERLENERQNQANIMNLQWEREVQKLEEKRRQIGEPTAEKRRQDREKVMKMRAQEQQELAAARKREDETIIARRKAEDAQRQAKLEQEEEELKAIVRKEEEETKLLFAKEAEQKRLEAEARENSLYDEFDVQMIQLEDAMEKKVAESQKILAELDEKRKAISAMIDAQMKPTRPPTFRRGSKRYSNNPLATDVATVLAGKPPLERTPTLSKIEEQTANSKLCYSENPKDHPTPPQSDHNPTPIKRTLSYNGSIRSIGSEDAADIKAREEMDWINAEIMAEMVAADRAAAANKTEIEKNPRSAERIMSSNSGARYTKLEDPEDIKAREEMARINAEIMAAALVKEQVRVIATSKEVERQAVEDLGNRRAQEETEGLNAEIVSDVIAARQPQPVKALQSPSVIPHQSPPTRDGPTKLSTVHNSQNVLRFKKGGSYTTGAEAPEVEDQSRRQTQHSPTPFVYNGPKHKHLPTWADQAELPIVYGSHGVLKFDDEGAEMTVVELCEEKHLVPQPTNVDRTAFIYNGRRHKPLSTWVDQSKLHLVTGAWAMLAFHEGGTDMVAVGAPNRSSTRNRAPSNSLITRHELLPTWADQSKLTVVAGAWGMLSFRDGADMEVIRDPQSEQVGPRSHVSNSIPCGHLHNLTRLETTDSFTSRMPSYTKTRMPASRMPAVDLPEPQSHVSKQHVSMVDSKWISTNGGPDFTAPQDLQSEPSAIPKTEPMPNQTLSQTVVAEVVWFAQGKSSRRGHPHNVTGINPAEEFTSHMQGLDKTSMPISCPRDLPESANAIPNYLKQGHPTLGNPIGLAQDAEIKQQMLSPPNSLGSATPNHDNEKTIPVSQLASKDTPTEVVEVVGEKYDLNHPALNDLLHAHREGQSNGHRYWEANQSQLVIVKGGHGTLSFSEHGASLQVAVSASVDPYWADQAKLDTVRGLHGKLNFNENGAVLKVVKADPYQVDQAALATVMGDHGRLKFNENGAVLDVVKADHYWVDQATLATVMGDHGRLVFNEVGASVKVVKPHRSWVDQTTLAVVSGAYGRLVFNTIGASLEVVRPDSYWTANQAQLEVLRGSQAVLFNESGFSMEVAKLSTRQAAKPRNLYWEVNQADLKIMQGSHGSLHFTDECAAMDVPSVPEDEITQDTLSSVPIPASHGVDQAHLDILQGDHGMLSFNMEGAATLSYETLQVSSPIETGDFFPDDDSVDDEDNDYQHGPRDHYHNANDSRRFAPTKRTSLGPGALASLLNSVKGHVPLVTSLVGKGSYSSFNEDAPSPITPTDSNPSPVHINQPGGDEPMIQSSWPESVHRHETEFDSQEPHQELKAQASPRPTETEFDPYSYQTPISTPASKYSASGPHSNGFQPPPERTPNMSISAAVPISQRGNDSLISRARILFENASQSQTLTLVMKNSGEDEMLLGDYRD